MHALSKKSAVPYGLAHFGHANLAPTDRPRVSGLLVGMTFVSYRFGPGRVRFCFFDFLPATPGSTVSPRGGPYGWER